MDSTAFLNGRVTLHAGDCLAVLPTTLDENSIDSCVCDPPYHFTGGRVSGEIGHPSWNGKTKDDRRIRKSGFMGKEWDGGDIAFRPETWAAVLRVLKPGAHLVAFAAPKNAHRMFCAIEDGGFEIRDTIAWLFGAGFPKSHDVSKAIDRMRDDGRDIENVRKWLEARRNEAGITRKAVNEALGLASNGGGLMSSWTTNQTTACVPQWGQWLQLKALLQFGDEMDAEVWRLNGRKGQPGEAWNEREVVGRGKACFSAETAWSKSLASDYDITAPATDSARQWQGWGTALKPAHEPICLARKPLSEPTIAANVLRWGTGAINVDGCRVGMSKDVPASPAKDRIGQVAKGNERGRTMETDGFNPNVGRWPANVIHDGSDEVVEAFPESSVTGDRSARSRDAEVIGTNWLANNHKSAEHLDSGSAARFFASFPRKDDEWTPPANGAEPCLLQCHPRYGGSALLSVPWQPPLRLVQNVKSAGSLCDSCATAIALALAEVPLNPKPEGVLSQASISERNLHILSHNLALYVEGRESTDIITTTESLKILLGSVSYAIAEATNSEESEARENIGSGQKRLHYSSKADSDDRLGSKHPTVKPLDLMQYLVRLVTPPKGIVLDCFAGTGTTAEAAWREGFNAILIEREPEYLADIKRRMALCLAGPDERARESIKARLKGKPEDHGPLFDERQPSLLDEAAA